MQTSRTVAVMAVIVGVAWLWPSAPQVTVNIPLPTAPKTAESPAAAEVPPLRAPSLAAAECHTLSAISGMITDGSGTPVAGARIEQDGKTLGATSSDGRFDLTGNFTGTDVRVRAEGYLAWAVAPPWCRTRWEMEVVLRPVSAIRGIVLLEGEPLQGVSIDVINDRDEAVILPATRESGRCHVNHAEFPLTVLAQHPQYGEAEIRMTSGGEVVLELNPDRVLRGMVTDDKGHPVTAFRLEVRTLEMEPVLTVAVNDSVDGTFVVGPLGPDMVLVTATVPGTSLSATLEAEGTTAEDAQGINLVLEDSVVVLGTAVLDTGALVGGAPVRVRGDGNSRDAVTGEDGSFVVMFPRQAAVSLCMGHPDDAGEHCMCVRPEGQDEVRVRLELPRVPAHGAAQLDPCTGQPRRLLHMVQLDFEGDVLTAEALKTLEL